MDFEKQRAVFYKKKMIDEFNKINFEWYLFNSHTVLMYY